MLTLDPRAAPLGLVTHSLWQPSPWRLSGSRPAELGRSLFAGQSPAGSSLLPSAARGAGRAILQGAAAVQSARPRRFPKVSGPAAAARAGRAMEGGRLWNGRIQWQGCPPAPFGSLLALILRLAPAAPKRESHCRAGGLQRGKATPPPSEASRSALRRTQQLLLPVPVPVAEGRSLRLPPLCWARRPAFPGHCRLHWRFGQDWTCRGSTRCLALCGLLPCSSQDAALLGALCAPRSVPNCLHVSIRGERLPEGRSVRGRPAAPLRATVRGAPSQGRPGSPSRALHPQ